VQLLPTQISIVEIAIVVVLLVLAVVPLVMVIRMGGRISGLETTLQEERRRMAELHTYLERVCRTNTTRPEDVAVLGVSTDPYAMAMGAADPYAMGGAVPPSPMAQPGAGADYLGYGAQPQGAAVAAQPTVPAVQPTAFAAQTPPVQSAFDPQAARAQEQERAKQQALEYAQYQERMQAQVDSLQQQALSQALGASGSRSQRQTQPVPPR